MPDPMFRVSVIIPTWRPQGFAPLREAMAANADVDAEWIVIDDGSGPGYEAVYAELEDTPARILRMRENRRQGAARNAGLALARANRIKFLDADDRLDRGHLAALLRAAEDLPDGVIPFAPTRHVFAGGTTLLNDSWKNLSADPEAQLCRLLVRPFLHHCGAFFPRAWLEAVEGYDETLVTDEDGDLMIRLLRAGARFVPVPEVNYFYVHHFGEGRVSADDDRRKFDARRRVCDKLRESYADCGLEIPTAVREALAMRMDRIAMAYWTTQRAEARALLAEARRLSPRYRPAERWPLRLLRRVAGPSAGLLAARIARRIRGRPTGGTQA